MLLDCSKNLKEPMKCKLSLTPIVVALTVEAVLLGRLNNNEE